MTRLQSNQVNFSLERLLIRYGILSTALWVGVSTFGTAQAAGFRSPTECQTFRGEEHLPCLYSYIGIRDEHTGRLKEQNAAQNEMLDQLREQRDQVEQRTSEQETTDGSEPQRRTTEGTETPSLAATAPSQSAAAAPSFRSPEECRAYSGMRISTVCTPYIEIQQSKAGKVEEELRTQREMLGQLRDKVDRGLAERDSPPPPATALTPPIYPGYAYPGYGYSGYLYPPPGLPLYFGVPGFYYGRPFYGPSFFGPRFYGPRFGLGFYGPRFFGHRHR